MASFLEKTLTKSEYSAKIVIEAFSGFNKVIQDLRLDIWLFLK